MVKYATYKQKEAFIRKKRNIVTFKNGKQVITAGVTRDRPTGAVQLDGEFGYTSKWYNSMKDLLDAVDWAKMRRWHS